MSFETFIQKTASKKHLLATLEAKEKLKLFTLDEGGEGEQVYKRSVNHFVIAISVNGTDLIQGSSEELGLGEFFYNPIEGMLYVRLSDESDPKENSVYVTYRLFYSNLSANAPHNVLSGTLVNFDARIEKIGGLKLELDYENTGIALETNSSIDLENNDGFFDDLFDTLIFENNKVRFYSWNEDIPFSDARLIYRGLIANKKFSTQKISFTLKDELSVLRQPLEWGRFTTADGFLEDALIDKPKRIIFGRVDNIRLTGIDKTLEGFQLQGTISGDANRNLLSGSLSGVAAGSTITGVGTSFTTQITDGDRIRVIGPFTEFSYTVNTVNNDTSLTISGSISDTFSGFQGRNQNVSNNIIEGSGTDFINEISPNDSIRVTVGLNTFEYSVESITDAEEIILQDEIEVGFTGLSGFNLPEIPYRKKNRRWHIAGHKLREYDLEIEELINLQSFKVVDPLDVENGDFLRIDGNTYVVQRISTNIITLNQNLRTVVNVGDPVTKIPVSECLGESARYIIDRDFSIINTESDSILEFNDLAEFNVTSAKNIPITFEFDNASNEVIPSSTDVDMTTILQPRDWIRARSVNLPTWYEVLAVEPQSITLRNPVDFDFTGNIQIKNVSYINDNSLIVADCLGLESGNEWIRKPADAVQFLLEYSGLEDLNFDSFIEAKSDCPYDLALYYPANIGSEIPNLRQIVSDINGSVFGSLYLDTNFQYTYKILNSDKPIDLPVVKDEDIIGFSVQTKANIINSIILSYSPFVDIKAGFEAFKTIILESDFVNQAVGTKNQLQVTSYLFRESDANVIAQRWLFFRSLTQSVVTITSKLQYTLLNLNSPMLLDLSRLYKRFGGSSRRKIGLINSITKDGTNTIIQINDLGNVFSRVPAIAPDSTPDFGSSTDDLDRYGFVLDNLTETPDASSEEELGTNLIG
jgi:hypothetical protein